MRVFRIPSWVKALPNPNHLNAAEKKAASGKNASVPGKVGDSDAAERFLQFLGHQPTLAGKRWTSLSRKERRRYLRWILHSRENGKVDDRTFQFFLRLLAQEGQIGLLGLWEVWSLAKTNDQRMILVAPLLRSFERLTSRRRERLAQWIQDKPKIQLETIFRDPRAAVASWVVSEGIPLHKVRRDLLKLHLDFGVGEEVVTHLLQKGDGTWWNRSTLEEKMLWGIPRTLRIRVALADRFLRSLRGNARLPGELYERLTDEDLVLFKWVNEHLGGIGNNENRLGLLSPISRETYIWLHGGSAFIGILRAFAERDRTEERAKYWKGWIREIRDARLALIDEGPVCMMLIRDRLYIEFGETGNACYIYKWRNTDIPLSNLILPGGRYRDFKNRFLSLNFRYKEGRDEKTLAIAPDTKLDHHKGSWQQGNFKWHFEGRHPGAARRNISLRTEEMMEKLHGISRGTTALETAQALNKGVRNVADTKTKQAGINQSGSSVNKVAPPPTPKSGFKNPYLTASQARGERESSTMSPQKTGIQIKTEPYANPRFNEKVEGAKEDILQQLRLHDFINERELLRVLKLHHKDDTLLEAMTQLKEANMVVCSKGILHLS